MEDFDLEFGVVISYLYDKSKVDKDKEVHLIVYNLLKEGYDKKFMFRALLEQVSQERVIPKRLRIMDEIFTRIKPTLYFVYRLVSEEDSTVYIGSSRSIRGRVSTHISSDKEFSEIEVISCTDEKYMMCLENHLINKYVPLYNKSVNLDLAREWKGEVPEFTNIQEMDFEYVPYLFQVENKPKGYISIQDIHMKNINNIDGCANPRRYYKK